MSKSFELQIGEFIKRFEDRADAVMQGSVMRVGKSIVEKSPVDTGRFRANWQIGVGAAPTGTLDATDKDGGSTVSKIEGVAATVKADDTTYLANNLPYAVRLEDGHSQQAPSGMVGVTVVEFNDYVKSALREARSK